MGVKGLNKDNFKKNRKWNILKQTLLLKKSSMYIFFKEKKEYVSIRNFYSSFSLAVHVIFVSEGDKQVWSVLSNAWSMSVLKK